MANKRNIQFRGKRIEDNKWIYGYLADNNFINNVNEIAIPSEEVYPETVGQFTEVYDVNGTPIFEGDIVETFTIALAYRQVGNYPPPNIEVEEYEIERSVNKVEFSYGSFNVNGYPIMFEDMVTEEDDEYDIKFDLAISGHSHGGQIALPIIKAIIRNNGARKYNKGMYNINGNKLIVSSGIGMTKLPIRFMNKPQIVLIQVGEYDKL